MSHTTLYAIRPDGGLDTFAEYRNGHGSGPAVWSTLAPKYIADVRPPTGTDAPFTIDLTTRHWMDQGVLSELFAIADAGGMTESDRRTLWATDSYVVVKIDDLPCYADAFEAFVDAHGPALEGYAFSIGEQAADMRKIIDDPAAYRGVCWRQTSSGCEFDEGKWNDARNEAAARELAKDISGIFGVQDPPDALVNLLMAMNLEPVEEPVEYNIDMDAQHRFAPSADQSTPD